MYRKEVLLRNAWNDKERLLILPAGERGTAGRIWYEFEDRSKHIVFKFGFDSHFHPVWVCSTHEIEKSLQILPVTDNKWLQNPVAKKHGYLQGDRPMGLRERQARETRSWKRQTLQYDMTPNYTDSIRINYGS